MQGPKQYMCKLCNDCQSLLNALKTSQKLSCSGTEYLRFLMVGKPIIITVDFEPLELLCVPLQ